MLSKSLLFAAVFICTLAGIEIFRKWSLRHKLLDFPNERSSHLKPTPRGGGLIIVLVCLFFYGFFTIFTTRDFFWNYFLGAALVAFISWLDDLYSVSFVWRFLVHAAAALLVILGLNDVLPVNSWFFEFESFRFLKLLLIFLWIVWLTNAFNFMDGIDGIAGLQGVTAGLGWFIAGKLLHSTAAETYGGILAFSSLAFLIYNWQPAKIFMGDVGSAFLGYSFGVLPIIAGRETAGGNGENFNYWFFIGVTLVWFFLFDTILTFLGRVFRREKVWTAHRRHLYQQLVIGGYSHRFVALLYGLLSFIAVICLVASINFNNLIAGLYMVFALESLLLYFFTVSVRKRNSSTNKFTETL